MLKSIEGIYVQGEIKLQEKPDDIPQNTKVIVTFLTNNQLVSDNSQEQVLTNDPLDDFLEEANKIAQNHQLPSEYHFNRQEIYQDENQEKEDY